jgi:hypothetical protein
MTMPDEVVAADAIDTVPDEQSLLLLFGLVGIEFVALLGLLVWMR